MMRNNLTLQLVNYLFNISSWKISDQFVRYIKKPKHNFIWKIKLLNKNSIVTRVGENHKNSWDFALSYKWHDAGLSKLEFIIDKFHVDNRGLFIDVGSNMSLRSLTFLSSNKNCLLFEPNTDLHDFCNELFELNNFSSYKLHSQCLSDKNRRDTIYISSSSYMSSLESEIASQDDIIDERDVELITLDYHLSNYQEKVNYIKIDVEGHEFAVLAGAKDTIENHKPTILVEILDKEENRNSICNYFLNLDYKIYEVHNYNSINIFQEVINYKFSNESSNYLFVYDKKLIEVFNKN